MTGCEADEEAAEPAGVIPVFASELDHSSLPTSPWCSVFSAFRSPLGGIDPIARILRGRLTRTEYLGLRTGHLGSLDALGQLKLDDLADRLGGNRDRAKAIGDLVHEARREEQQAA